MTGKPISVGGIEIPSDAPLFLALIAIHVLAAMVCVIAGVIAMSSKKQRGRHSVTGTVYFFGLVIVFITVTIISILRWKEDYYLFVLGLISFCAALTGRTAMRQKWHGWAFYHVTGMGFSYIVLITAFYIDNGKFLPVWKDLPPVVYWTLPSLLGIPLIVFTLWRHPIMKK